MSDIQKRIDKAKKDKDSLQYIKRRPPKPYFISTKDGRPTHIVLFKFYKENNPIEVIEKQYYKNSIGILSAITSEFDSYATHHTSCPFIKCNCGLANLRESFQILLKELRN